MINVVVLRPYYLYNEVTANTVYVNGVRLKYSVAEDDENDGKFMTWSYKNQEKKTFNTIDEAVVFLISEHITQNKKTINDLETENEKLSSSLYNERKYHDDGGEVFLL